MIVATDRPSSVPMRTGPAAVSNRFTSPSKSSSNVCSAARAKTTPTSSEEETVIAAAIDATHRRSAPTATNARLVGSGTAVTGVPCNSIAE